MRKNPLVQSLFWLFYFAANSISFSDDGTHNQNTDDRDSQAMSLAVREITILLNAIEENDPDNNVDDASPLYPSRRSRSFSDGAIHGWSRYIYGAQLPIMVMQLDENKVVFYAMSRDLRPPRDIHIMYTEEDYAAGWALGVKCGERFFLSISEEARENSEIIQNAIDDGRDIEEVTSEVVTRYNALLVLKILGRAITPHYRMDVRD